MSKVYFTKDISGAGLVKIYESLNKELKGKIAIKISTGEPGGNNYLKPNLIKPLVDKLNGTIVECCTAYKGRRFDYDEHRQVLIEHGFDIMPCDILDKEELELKVEGGKHLKVNYVGSNITNYDSLLMLSHFKGHAMGGFGGALKNMSIGFASKEGKAWIHSCGITKDVDLMWKHTSNQDGFLESMADASKSIIDYFGEENILYINVCNNLSIDCDCDSNPSDPEMEDIGIFASLDPVALDKCCYDQIINSTDLGKTSLINRMKEKNAYHIIEASVDLKLGNEEYELINID